jgi:hypothetical protein
MPSSTSIWVEVKNPGPKLQIMLSAKALLKAMSKNGLFGVSGANLVFSYMHMLYA